MKLNDVLYPIVGEIAAKLEAEDYFTADPELYTVALFLEAKRNLRPGPTIINALELAMSDDNVEEARRLLKRKKATSK